MEKNFYNGPFSVGEKKIESTWVNCQFFQFLWLLRSNFHVLKKRKIGVLFSAIIKTGKLVGSFFPLVLTPNF
jgi:hypothetical protein